MKSPIPFLIAGIGCFTASLLAKGESPDDRSVIRGADEILWVPTLEQGLQMAKVTGKPLLLMGYSLVDTRSTYTKIDEAYCSSVF